MDCEVQRSASDYAKARIEQIRKKFGYSNNKENKVVKPKEFPQSQVLSKELAQKNTPVKYQNFSTHKETGTNKDLTEYHDRIKNIDVLNRRILDILNNKENKCSEIDSKKQIKKQQPILSVRYQDRRASAPIIEKSEKENQGLCLFQSNFKTQTKMEVKNTPSLFDKKSKEPEFKQNKKQHLGLYIPNNKCTVSVELQQTPKVRECAQTSRPLKNISEAKVQSLLKTKLEQKTKKKNQQQPIKKQSVKLAQKLSEQITKDQNLSFSKWEFSEWKNSDKWDLLKNKLNLNYSIEKIKQIFSLQPEQHNPFYELKEPLTAECVQNLIKNYNESEQFWQKSLKQCCSIVELEKQFFNIKQLDLNKKGYLSIEDVVCFVNLLTGKFYRNRDAIGLVKRFTEGKQITEGIKYQRFLDKITKN